MKFLDYSRRKTHKVIKESNDPAMTTAMTQFDPVLKLGQTVKGSDGDELNAEDMEADMEKTWRLECISA